ncbi:MAG: twin-arginine translocase TatA/TatE family subunit [Kiritimatiellia bacterium]|nr:twin-arginine translocase TatA/TatE family subunit [Kiritimatiellia bacterium]
MRRREHDRHKFCFVETICVICPVGFIFSSLGAGEILLVLGAALLLFGAERFPSMARALGQALSEIRRAANEFSSAIMDKDWLSSSDKNSSEQRNQREIKEEGEREG